MYHLTEAYLMAAYICTLAGFLGALLCGVVFAGVYSGGLQRFAVLVSVILAIASAVGSLFSAVPSIYGLLMVALAALMSVSFFALMLYSGGGRIQPHGVTASWASVLFGVGCLMALCLIVGLVYVLPGQFTFWGIEGPAH